MSVKRDLLIELLNCGYADLELLEDVQYPLHEVLEQLDGCEGRFTLNDFMRAVVDLGIAYLEEAIEIRVEELLTQTEGREPDASEAEELRVLRETLDPSNDVMGFFNCLDTHVWFEANEGEYRRYLPDAVASFEYNTGLAFC